MCSFHNSSQRDCRFFTRISRDALSEPLNRPSVLAFSNLPTSDWNWDLPFLRSDSNLWNDSNNIHRKYLTFSTLQKGFVTRLLAILPNKAGFHRQQSLQLSHHSDQIETWPYNCLYFDPSIDRGMEALGFSDNHWALICDRAIIDKKRK